MKPGFGLVLFGRDVCAATLAAVGAGARDSSYTEADPGPGHPEPQEAGSRWRPYLTRAQSRGVTVGTIKGGYPARDGASVLYRLADDAAAIDYRSWQDPVLVTGWSSPADGWGGSQVYDAFAATVIAATGVIVVTAAVSGTGDAQTWSFDLRSRTWTTLYDWDAGALDGLELPIGMAYDPEARRLLLWSGFSSDGARQQTAYASTDGGATWSQYSRAFATGIGAGTYDTTGIYRPVVGTDLDWLLVVNEVVNGTGSDNAAHLASSDRGVTWDLVSDSGVSTRSGSPVRGPAGFAYIHVDPTHSNRLSCRIAAHARAPFATEVVIDDTVQWSAVWATADDDGTLYAVARGASGAATFGDFYVFRSLDGGLSWDRYAWGALSTSSSTRTLEPHLLVASCGELHLIGTTRGSTSTDGTVQIVTFGGWSQVSHGSGSTNFLRTPLHRFGYGQVDVDAAGTAWTIGYLPIALPNNMGWTASGGTGTASLTDAEPGLHLSTTAGQAIDYFYAAPHSATYAAEEFEFKLSSSGNVSLATLGATGDGVYALFLLSSGAYYYEARIDVGTDGIQLVDTNLAGSPAIRATAPIDPKKITRVRMHLTKGTATAWWSQDGGVTWTRWANGEAITNAAAFAAGADAVFFGIKSGHVGDVTIRFVGAGAAVDWQYGLDGIAAIGDSPATGPLGHNFGHPVPGRGWAYPIPEGTGPGEELALLSATGGPTHFGELVDLPVRYAHGIEQADPLLYPSPRRTWRTTRTDTDAVLVWDQGEDQETWFGNGVALVVIGTPRLWTLERDDGSSGWEAVGTLDLALGENLRWTRVGRTVVPASGTPTIPRRFGENELARQLGGTFDLDGTCRRVLRSSPGFWTDDTSQQRVRLTLEGIDGSEPDTGTAGVLCAPGGILVAYPSAATPRRYLRVTAAANQSVPDGYYEAGIVAVGRVVGLDRPSWGQSQPLQVSRTYAVSSDGVSTAQQQGPPRRLVQYAWSEPTPMFGLRTLAQSPETIQASGGLPIGTEHNEVDLPAYVGLLESGALPCAIVSALPTSTGTVLDPTLWVLGRLSSIDLQLTGAGGWEGLNEALTVGGIAVEEFP